MNDDEIDRYLATLRARLDRREVDLSRLIEEAEEHLRDTQDALVAGGWTPAAAAAAAVERFGVPASVARRLPLVGGPVGRQVVRALAPLVAVALVAVGAGGLLALGVSWATDAHETGVSRTALWCQVFVGVLGLGVLEARWRRRVGRPDRKSGLPARFVPAAGVVSFGLATAALAVYGMALALWDRAHHMPRPLLTGLACLGVAVFYGIQFLHRPASSSSG